MVSYLGLDLYVVFSQGFEYCTIPAGTRVSISWFQSYIYSVGSSVSIEFF